MIPHLTTLGHSRGRLVALCLIVAVPLVAIAAALGVGHFRKDATDTAQARLLLENIRANAYKQSALEWRAIAEGEVGASSLRALDKGSVEMNHDLALLADDGWAAQADDLHALLDTYTEAVRDEFALLAAGREQAASKVDEERVDPAFELLQERADALGRRIAEHRTHAERRATVGAAAILILATSAIVLLLVVFHRSRQRSLASAVARAGLERQVQATKQLAREREREANHDSLTGLANRRYFLRRLESEVAQATAEGERMAVLLIDLDRFKEINDTLGHKAGDSLLEQLGPRMLGVIRDRDLVVRLGGDEFAVLIPAGEAVTGAHAEALAGRIREAISAPYTIEGLRLHVEGSVGIALFPDDAPDADSLLRHADVAMYQAKRSRLGQTRYEAGSDSNSRERLALAGELHGAMARNELVLHYQPKAEIDSGAVSSVEALVRWQHPEHGLLPPARFIPVAEHAGLMRPLTLYVLDAALAQRARWSEQGIELDMAVNVAAANLIDLDMPTEIARLLERHGVEASALQLEITEDTLMTDPAHAGEVIERLGELGVTLSLDDFGTGYSSLAQLKRLHVDEIKIDRSFVCTMTDEGDSDAIVRSTIDLARSLDLRVVAEGVETAAALRALESYGCDLAQGYYISRPVPAAELTEWLTAQSRAAGRMAV